MAAPTLSTPGRAAAGAGGMDDHDARTASVTSIMSTDDDVVVLNSSPESASWVTDIHSRSVPNPVSRISHAQQRRMLRRRRSWGYLPSLQRGAGGNTYDEDGTILQGCRQCQPARRVLGKICDAVGTCLCSEETFPKEDKEGEFQERWRDENRAAVGKTLAAAHRPPRIAPGCVERLIFHLTSPPSPHLTPPHLTSPHLTSPLPTSPHLSSPHLTSPQLSSAHLTSPRQPVTRRASIRIRPYAAVLRNLAAFLAIFIVLPLFVTIGIVTGRGLHSSTFQLNLSALVWDRGCA